MEKLENEMQAQAFWRFFCCLCILNEFLTAAFVDTPLHYYF